MVPRGTYRIGVWKDYPEMMIFLGLVDLASVNAFIVHKLALNRHYKHVAFMRLLHTEILSQRAETLWLETTWRIPLPRHPHMLEKTEETNDIKRRQWLCKGCSANVGAGVRSCETRSFCACACARKKKGDILQQATPLMNVYRNVSTIYII
ncbi:Hypothetical protein PHPALM_3847 [Phytophthora palmivora]|uniref:PiggyBac transposable element-derived protein domain-containing protein n=1 Tax=Phytophthora palmivora TaxID=4796 RepID=A0A2P4YLD7_9STRA|nr:Hypothetical protein PHPALM_3847 [Phytophthora palmivora]